jgi:hypothetical protein
MDAALATDKAIDKAKGPKGRKDGEKQEMVTQPQVVRDRMPDMVRLYKAADAAGVQFSEAVKATAEASGYNTKAVRARILAEANDTFEEKKRDVSQQMELFTEVGQAH